VTADVDPVLDQLLGTSTRLSREIGHQLVDIMVELGLTEAD